MTVSYYDSFTGAPLDTLTAHTSNSGHTYVGSTDNYIFRAIADQVGVLATLTYRRQATVVGVTMPANAYMEATIRTGDAYSSLTIFGGYAGAPKTGDFVNGDPITGIGLYASGWSLEIRAYSNAAINNGYTVLDYFNYSPAVTTLIARLEGGVLTINGTPYAGAPTLVETDNIFFSQWSAGTNGDILNYLEVGGVAAPPPPPPPPPPPETAPLLGKLVKDITSTTVTPGSEGSPGTPPTPAYCVTTSQTLPGTTITTVDDGQGGVVFLGSTGAPVTRVTTVCYPATPGTPPTPATLPVITRDFHEGWNGGARSLGTVTGSGGARFAVSATTVGAVVGFHTGAAQTFAYAEVSHGFYFRAGVAGVIESGVQRTGGVPYTATDFFRVERAESVVRYYKADALVYTSEVPSTGTVYLEAALYYGGDTVYDAELLTAMTVGFASGNAVMLPVAARGGNGASYAEGGATLLPLTSAATGIAAQGGGAVLQPLSAAGAEGTYSTGGAVLPALTGSASEVGGVVPNYAIGAVTLPYMLSAGFGRTALNTISPLNSLSDNTTGWAGGQYDGYTVVIVAGTGAGQTRTVLLTTGQSLIVDSNWSTVLDETSAYEVRDSLGNVVATGTVTPAGGQLPKLLSLGSDRPYGGGTATLEPLGAYGTYTVKLQNYALLRAPAALLSAVGHDSTGENAFSYRLSAPAARAFGGVNAYLTLPKPTLTSSATVTILANAALRMPRATLAASATSSVVGNAALSFGKLTGVGYKVTGYSGAVVSVRTLGGFTLQATSTGGSLGGTVITMPLFELVASGTRHNFGSADLLAPSAALGAQAQAWLMAPGSLLVATGYATVAVTYEGYATNLNHIPRRGVEPVDEVTQYTNYPFDRIVRYKNSYYGMNSTGLYLLEGTTDHATVPAPVSWAVQTGLTDFGSAQLKTVAMIYFGGRMAPSSTINLYAGEGAAQPYSYTTPRGALAQNHRQALGKGVKARYYAFGFEGEGVLSIDSVTLNVAQLTRRI